MTGLPGDPGPESRYTPPTAICPNPERWSSTDDDSTEIEVSAMLAGLVRGLQPSLCIETGSAWGQTSEAIGHALHANGHGRLAAIEPDPERAEHTARRCAGLPVDVVNTESLDYKPNGPIGFVFFDSLFPLRCVEFLAWRDNMHPGTVVAFHDSAPGHGGGQFPNGRDLRGTIETELVDHLRVIHLPTPRGITIAEVR